MFATLKKLFGGDPEVPAQRAAPMPGVTEVLNPGPPFVNGDPNQPVPRSPAKGAALVAASPAELIATQEALIEEMRGFSPLAHEEFDALMRPVFLRYAAWVHLLPASETHHHCGPGGLLRHGLEVCLHVTRKAEGTHVGVDLVPSARTLYSPRWKVAAALAGLLHDVGKALVDIGAVDEAGTLNWTPQSMSLHQWLEHHGLRHYYLNWRPGARHHRHKVIAASVAREIIGPELLRYLTEGGAEEVVDALMAALADNETHNEMSALVHFGDSTSVDLDLAEQARNISGSGEGASRSIASRVLGAIRKRVDSGQWGVNRPGSPLWLTDSGFYGIFPGVLEGAVEDLRRSGARSLPVNVSDYLSILADYHHIDVAEGDNGEKSRTWLLTLHSTQEGSKPTPALQVVRFTTAEYIVGALPMPAPALATVTRPFAADRAAAAQAAALAVTAPAAAPASTAHSAPAPSALATAPASEPAPEPGLPDRRNRGDLADASSVERQRQQQQRSRAPAQPESFAEWMTQIEGAGFEGPVVAAVLQKFADGKLHYGYEVHLASDGLALRYPAAFEGEAIPPGEMLEGLQRHGWLVVEASSDRKVSEHDFGDGERSKCVVLSNAPFLAVQQLQREQPDLFVRQAQAPSAIPAKKGKAAKASPPQSTAQAASTSPAAPPASNPRARAVPAPDPARSVAVPIGPEEALLPKRGAAAPSQPQPPDSDYAMSFATALTPLKIESMCGEFYLTMQAVAHLAGQSDPSALASKTIYDLAIDFAKSKGILMQVLNAGLMPPENALLVDMANRAHPSITPKANLKVNPNYEPPAWLRPYISKPQAQVALPIT